MTNSFYISDIHFGHHNILKYESENRKFDTIEEHDEKIIENWNSVVSDNDRVWILGDVVINKKNLHKASRLKGQKRLIMGNHDNFKNSVYRDELCNIFYQLYGNVEQHFGSIKTILTHIPVHPMQFYRFDFNLHGHLHGKSVMKYHSKNISSDTEKDIRYVNLSLEHINLTPVAWEDVQKELVKRKELIN